ncbi:MepB family protein [Ekhidna sp.]|uniref:MepB family protein n=1 Tax=Ekhidna sp. TaxID=2608089 RepID=UPI0032EBF843
MLSTDKKEGKRAFRVYPNWDAVKSKQAERTQKWELNYFYQINSLTDYKKYLNCIMKNNALHSTTYTQVI